MNGGLYIALSGVVAERQKLDIITDNLSNANTVGYKSSGSVFGEFLSRKTVQIFNTGSNKPLVDKAYPVTLNSYTNISEDLLRKRVIGLIWQSMETDFLFCKPQMGLGLLKTGLFP